VVSAPAPAPSVASAPAPAAPPPPSVPKPRAKKVNAYASDEGYDVEGDAKAEKKSASPRNNTNDGLLQRAERLFAAERWAEAAAAYRELLRRDPHGDYAERWRQRLVAAEAAQVNERNANLAEKRNAEASDRAKKPAAASKAAKSPGKAAASDAAQ